MKKFFLSSLIMLCFVTYSYTQQYLNCRPDNSNLWTGSVNKVLFSYPVTDDELIVGNPFQNRGWAKFNIVGIPDNATIDNAEIGLFVYQASSTPSSHELVLSSLYVDPETSSGNTLWNSIVDPPDYLVESSWGDVVGQKFRSNLTTMINDIQSSLTRNWFAVGFYERNEDAIACYIIGHSNPNAPYLVIGFSLPAPTGVSATDGTLCDNVRITWNAVPNADRYYIYKGTTSLGYTSNLYFDYSGASTSPEEYRVYAAKSTVDNMFSSKYGSNTGYKKTIPSQPGTITGLNTVCQGSSQTYSISPVSGATSYTWTLPAGWSGSSTTTSIVATAGANTGNISVTANNSCGSSSPKTLYVTVQGTPSRPGTITGSTSVCQGTTNKYSIASVPGATTYTWSFPAGWSGSSTSTMIYITAGTSSGNISVTAGNSCGTSSAEILAVKIISTPSQPASICCLTAVCQGSSHTFSIEPVTDADPTSYTWTLPSGWSGSSTSSSITVTAGSNGGNISVTATNDCGTSTPSIKSIAIASIPTISTSSVITISSSSATTGGNITSNGGAEVTVSGVCWSTSPDPTISDSKTTDGTTTGSFTSTITGLIENQTYYIRAYATNCSGTGYGSPVVYNSSNAIEVIKSDEISVYPNPVSGILNIEYKNGIYTTINIINPQGVLLKTEKVVSPQQLLDFSKYESGLYILEFVKPGGEKERARVIKH